MQHWVKMGKVPNWKTFRMAIYSVVGSAWPCKWISTNLINVFLESPYWRKFGSLFLLFKAKNPERKILLFRKLKIPLYRMWSLKLWLRNSSKKQIQIFLKQFSKFGILSQNCHNFLKNCFWGNYRVGHIY